MLQLKNCALNVAKEKNNLAVAEMFSIGIKFERDCLIKWFNKKFRSKNLELSNDGKRKYGIEKPIDWLEGQCFICKFLLKINPTNFNAAIQQMSYADFVIFKEHKFLRHFFWTRAIINRFTKKHGTISHMLWKVFENFCLFKNSISTINEFSECYNDELIDFCNECCADCSDFAEIK